MKLSCLGALFYCVLLVLSINFANAQTIRIATFNAYLNRTKQGELLQDLLADEKSEQIENVAEIIQRIRPDILILQEFDYDVEGRSLKLFEEKYLAKSQNGTEPIDYPYFYIPETNTGFPSGEDFDNDGKIEGGGDAFGFGVFPGQYGFAILSKYPIEIQNIRTFQKFLWKDMPDANLPINPETNESYYSNTALNVFRLSSKNHVDFPIKVEGETLHVIVAHPTPPVFDAAEDKNGKRNHDEIRLITDYINNAAYLYDDKGVKGGLESGAYFVIGGDMNADPNDGDTYDHAIRKLLEDKKVNAAVIEGSKIPKSKGGVANTKKSDNEQLKAQISDPKYDTSDWGLRVDYLIPSANINVKKSGIFWPENGKKLSYLTDNNASSDHRLVWLDIELK
ncbi:endonuclease/exonuclease/phosphatase family protein [Chondrinema litorale]|uniref:endonuclease/exonuclease/phosphatase family protein n=1 Tax=Chondrinema litorale TaxID=2994555 RepID=UPI002542C8E8|nr:endonuclease/exonuclease/phosphatase family protein [Chondrinema litorale]UZR94372.1 endonuclease/exonuclease/phosphatase family protein [Chondrinema litorale]